MATLSGHLDGHVGRAGPADGTLPDAPYTATEHARYVTGATIGVAGGKVPTDRVLFSKGTAGGAVKMQVTSGISLAALPTAMRYLGGEQDNESGAQTADRTPGRDALYRTITEPIDVVGAAPDLATQALQNLRNALNAVNPAAGATLGASAQLEGLLAALMMTLKMLQVPIDGPIKYRLPLMARTNFAAMFESLPKPQRRLLKTEHARLTTAILAASNTQPLISQTMGVLPDTGLTAGSPLIRSATRPANFPGEIVPPKPDVAFAPVTIGEWIKGITHGHDYLAPSEMDKFLKKANTPSATRDDVLKNRQLLESFGSVGKMDKRGKTPLAVFENRGISPTPAPYTMPLAAALRIAWNQLLFFKALREHPNAPGAYPDEDVGVRPGEND